MAIKRRRHHNRLRFRMLSKCLISLFFFYSCFLTFCSAATGLLHEKFTYENTQVHILHPEGSPKGLLVVFPGLGFDLEKMKASGDIITLALQHQIIVVFPEMKLSLYADTAFGETNQKLKHQWGKKFISHELKELIEELSKRHALPIFAYGLSTGCRGAVLSALQIPNIKGLALVSGDYQFSLDPEDALAIKFLGPFAQFPERWQQIGNLMEEAKMIKCPVFLAAGSKDKVVNPLHTETFYRNIRAPKVIFIDPQGKHEPFSWRKADAKGWEFFESLLK